MEQWALVVGNSLLLVAALVGGGFTLARSRPLGRTALALAVPGCGVLLFAAVLDLVWWLAVFPESVRTGEIDSVTTVADVGVLINHVLLVTGIGLLLAAAHAGRQVRRPAMAAAHRAGHAARSAGAGQAVPAGGWTPPQQTRSDDWSHMSGVWSIPPGVFDGPPPGSR
jgi:hypothetical protein